MYTYMNSCCWCRLGYASPAPVTPEEEESTGGAAAPPAWAEEQARETRGALAALALELQSVSRRVDELSETVGGKPAPNGGARP